jgi:hypothetical protein
MVNGEAPLNKRRDQQEAEAGEDEGDNEGDVDDDTESVVEQPYKIKTPIQLKQLGPQNKRGTFFNSMGNH